MRNHFPGSAAASLSETSKSRLEINSGRSCIVVALAVAQTLISAGSSYAQQAVLCIAPGFDLGRAYDESQAGPEMWMECAVSTAAAADAAPRAPAAPILGAGFVASPIQASLVLDARRNDPAIRGGFDPLRIIPGAIGANPNDTMNESIAGADLPSPPLFRLVSINPNDTLDESIIGGEPFYLLPPGRTVVASR